MRSGTQPSTRPGAAATGSGFPANLEMRADREKHDSSRSNQPHLHACLSRGVTNGLSSDFLDRGRWRRSGGRIRRLVHVQGGCEGTESEGVTWSSRI